MKGKDKKALHSKTIGELGTLLREKRQELVKNQLEIRSGKQKNVHTKAVLRRDIAMLETIKRAKETAHHA